jgi:predicted exporter
MHPVRRFTANKALRRAWPAGAWCACILLIAVAILQVQDYASNSTLEACELRNEQISELNNRTQAINNIVDTLRSDPDTKPHQYVRLVYSYSSEVTLSDCEELFPKPWPLGYILE